VNRKIIVNAALELLNESGLDGVTVRGLAARLGVQNPALYWHFPSKLALLDEMAQQLQSRQDFGPPFRANPGSNGSPAEAESAAQLACSEARTCRRASWMRDFRVPTGTARWSAISS
jgi:AcrR family transcriptional regulator